MQVEVVRSRRRRKTVHARQVDGVLQISIPSSMSKDEERHWVEEMTRRFERRARTDAINLDRRAAALADRHDLPKPESIRWVDNQVWRWGSCTPAEGSIRISSRVAGFPAWVIDYVIVHELAHFLQGGHGDAFWKLVNRYPLAERARGFLIAKGLEDSEAPDHGDAPVMPVPALADARAPAPAPAPVIAETRPPAHPRGDRRHRTAGQPTLW